MQIHCFATINKNQERANMENFENVLCQFWLKIFMWCHIEDKCAILYDGINQQGASENIPIGEFEHSRNGFLFKAIFCTKQHDTCLYMLGLNPLWATIISTVKQLCYSAIDQNQLTSIQLGLIRKILVLMGASIDSFGI